MPRRGAILIIVAGLSALLASLSLAFLLRMRADAQDADQLNAELQARIMLTAACSYVQEASRLGYDVRDPSLSWASDDPHEEAYGWIDVRGGIAHNAFVARYGREPDAAERAAAAIGPRLDDDGDGDGVYDPAWSPTLVVDGDGDGIADRPAWPAIGGVAICPMWMRTRPPYAISPRQPNPMETDETAADFGMPYLRNPDPQLLPSTASGLARWDEFRLGDPTPRQRSLNLAWFRVRRDGPATFVLTCGAGATRGLRDWDEVRGLGLAGTFPSQEDFTLMREHEVRLWYRIEWSPRVGDASLNNLVTRGYSEANTGPDSKGFHYAADGYATQGHNASFTSFRTNNVYSGDAYRDHDSRRGLRTYSRSGLRNPVGVIQWIQRLRAPPEQW